jgi:hypothetical protein
MSNNFFTKPASSPSPSQPPNSRQKIIDYALRRLGAPVIQINIDDDQIQDRLDDALQLFREYHYDGVEKFFLSHQVTQDDINNEWIPAPNPIQSVTRAFVFDQLGVNNIFDFPWKFGIGHLGDMAGGGFGAPFADLQTLDITKRWLSLAQQLLSPEKTIRFNKVTNKIFIEMNWEEDVEPGTFLLFEAWMIVDPGAFTEVFNDNWLKSYFTALLKRQWAQNLSKYEGIQMPGGVVWSGTKITDEATKEIAELLADLDLRYSLPPDFMMG